MAIDDFGTQLMLVRTCMSSIWGNALCLCSRTPKCFGVDGRYGNIFRISPAVSRSYIVANIDGYLTRENARIAQEYCSKLLVAEKPFHIIVREVSAVDEVH